MKYERLTEYDEQGIVHYIRCDEYPNKGCYGECGSCGVQIKGKQRLAELEDKIEDGTLVELPCKVGDMVYGISTFSSRIVYGCVKSIQIIEFTTKYILEEDGWINRLDEVFLTKAEAEKRLEELRGEV